MKLLKLSIFALAAGLLFAPLGSQANAASHMVTIQTESGKSMQLRMMKIGGEMMILVPQSSACTVFGHFMANC
jgi:hypothetical protein